MTGSEPTGQAARSVDMAAACGLRAVLPILASVLALALAPTSAHGQDHEAPHGMGQRWLPCDEWVMMHWVPFDEPRLYAELGTSRAGVLRWLRDDEHHDLAQLARRRRVSVPALAARLVEGRDAGVTGAAELRQRTERVLTQGHLAQHLLFHRFHQPAIAYRARATFGLSATAFQRERIDGRSPAVIAAARGRSRAVVEQRVMAILRGAARDGVRVGATSRPQADSFLRAQRRGLDHWLDSRIQGATHPREPALPPDHATRHMTMCRLFSGRYRDGRAPDGEALARAVLPAAAAAIRRWLPSSSGSDRTGSQRYGRPPYPSGSLTSMPSKRRKSRSRV